MWCNTLGFRPLSPRFPCLLGAAQQFLADAFLGRDSLRRLCVATAVAAPLRMSWGSSPRRVRPENHDRYAVGDSARFVLLLCCGGLWLLGSLCCTLIRPFVRVYMHTRKHVSIHANPHSGISQMHSCVYTAKSARLQRPADVHADCMSMHACMHVDGQIDG